jgi:hypothetical protein
MRTSTFVKSLLAAAAVGAPLLCNAASTLSTGTGSPLTATAQVQFTITVPHFLYLRVGTGSAYTTGTYTTVGTVDLITWTLTPATMGTGTLAGTGGDLSGGIETAAVVGNGGNITLTGTTSGPLTDAAGDTISYANITTTPSKLNSATPLPAPTLADGATSAAVTVTATNKVASQDAKWAYAYTNTAMVAQGTYGTGTTGGNGTVTYTASMP